MAASVGITALEWVVFNVYKSQMGPQHGLGGRGCYYATFRTFGKMEMGVGASHSRREAVSSRLMGFLNAGVLPCWLTVSQSRNNHGDANAPRLPSRSRPTGGVFPPIVTASAARNSQRNNAVMNAFSARLSAGRPGRPGRAPRRRTSRRQSQLR